jgi:hypothetical protein
MEIDLPLRIVLEKPPTGVDFGIQMGKGNDYRTISVQRSTRKDLVFECSVTVKDNRADGLPNFVGPVSQGPQTDRFVYIDVGTYAGQENTQWSRRIKLPLHGITWEQINEAKDDPKAVLEARIPGMNGKGEPSCGTVRPVGGWTLGRKKRSRTL